ncbi:hypothetical protein FIE12Z_10988 [Fusarium flagelliforme]|uniref:Clavaminate synthase-like protein n=1 Tax=Fusarium flagelliforme TaxID=2675880 RepID=A0A395MA91_9HYPO|nr:hypothetical protein FIE12Z_10988 [Fusarium flagelliforme]
MAAVEVPFDKEFGFLKFHDDVGFQGQDEIAVKRTAYWSHCGPLIDTSDALPSTFLDFETRTFTGSVQDRLVPFLNRANSVLHEKGFQHYFLTIRASTPTHDFDRPRWHTDELFFTDTLPGTRLGLKSSYTKAHQNNGTNWKICTTLLGPSTLFLPHQHQSSAREAQETARRAASTDHNCSFLTCIACAAASDAVRNELASTLAPCGAEVAELGECAVFKVGREFGAVHSEPCMSEGETGRVFVNVVPGTEGELKELMERWGMEFPRQWEFPRHLGIDDN